MRRVVVVMKVGHRGGRLRGSGVFSLLRIVPLRLNILIPVPHLVIALELHLPAAAYGPPARVPWRLPHMSLPYMSLRSKLIALLLGTLSAYAAPMTWPDVAGAASCPNEEVRAEQASQRLPDCRAFELVTPEVKGDNGTFKNAYVFPDGNHVYYNTLLPLPGAGSATFSNGLSTRTASGWVNTALSPPSTGPGNQVEVAGLTQGNAAFINMAAFTGDFSQVFVDSTFDTDPLDQDFNALSPQKSTVDAYRLDLSTGVWSLASLPDTGPMLASYNDPDRRGLFDGSFIAGVSEDGSHVLFQTHDNLPVAPGTPSEPHTGDMLYDRSGGHTYVVGVLPDGEVPETCWTVLGEGAADSNHTETATYGAISRDGSNIVFTTSLGAFQCGPSEGVYLRKNDASASASTVRLPGTGYLARSSDGSKVFTWGRSGEVFEYDVATGVTSTITTAGNLVASSADGSRVYYLTAPPEPKLYLWDGGTSILIPNAGQGMIPSGGQGRAKERFFFPRSEPTGAQYAVATPDGSRLLFLNSANLTGFENFGPRCNIRNPAALAPGFCEEAYVYDATTGGVTCVSCNPAGAPPLGSATLTRGNANTAVAPFSEGVLSPDGSRVFFGTADALVPQDTNGVSDVYEWDKGRVYLISSGQGTAGSILDGVSSDGSDVFLTTADRLAPQDIETARQIYDARVDGGFPYRPFATGCDSGQCQGPQTSAPVFGAPASATFMGTGNPAPPGTAPAQNAKPRVNARRCKKGFVKKRHKCVRKRASKSAKRAGGGRGVGSHA
jgi:hypothetical protein